MNNNNLPGLCIIQLSPDCNARPDARLGARLDEPVRTGTQLGQANILIVQKCKIPKRLYCNFKDKNEMPLNMLEDLIAD
jgi:hypothetical protein